MVHLTICEQAKDFDGLNERLRKVANWETDDPDYLSLVDNNRVFFECLLEQVGLAMVVEVVCMAQEAFP